MPALDNSSLADRLAALFQCGQPVSENDAIALIGELLASWQTNGVPIIGLSEEAETPSFEAAVVSGTVAAGARSVSFTSSSDFVGTVLGVSFPANVSMGFQAQLGHTLAALVYTRSAGTLYIAKTV